MDGLLVAETYALSFFILPGIITNDSSMFLGWVVHCINGFRLRYFSGLLDIINGIIGYF